MDDTQSDTAVEKMLTVAKVAEVFDVTSATIRVWINEDRLRAVKIGKGHYWRVPESAVRELADKMYGEGKNNDAS